MSNFVKGQKVYVDWGEGRTMGVEEVEIEKIKDGWAYFRVTGHRYRFHTKERYVDSGCLAYHLGLVYNSPSEYDDHLLRCELYLKAKKHLRGLAIPRHVTLDKLKRINAILEEDEARK